MAKTTLTKPATKPAMQPAPPKKPAPLPDVNLGSFSTPTPPAPKAAPTANETPATYLAKHEKPLLPNEQTIKEIAKARAKVDAKRAEQVAKPAEPQGGRYVIITGEGTMPIGADNWRRVQRGVSISVSADELAWLERSGVAFKRA